MSLPGMERRAESRIADPADPSRIFSWLICESYDDKGNVIAYNYKPEDGERVELAQAHERNRGDRLDDRRKANRYIKADPLREPQALFSGA